jgi:hypothetical protein
LAILDGILSTEGFEDFFLLSSIYLTNLGSLYDFFPSSDHFTGSGTGNGYFWSKNTFSNKHV